MAKDSITKASRLCSAMALALSVVAAAPAQTWTVPTEGDIQVPEPAREFRGVWIATVYNIDWPSSAGAAPATQQAELIQLLDLAESLNLNAVILQVRPMSDAFYESAIEPWSKFLTGKNGRAPSPRWDPLAFAVENAHARGLELHAWFNPFRGSVSSAGELAANHITRTNPEVVRQAGSTQWLDPTSPLVRERALDVMVDVARRYDVDGVHIDDYFYPYPSNGGGPNFDDDANWQAYRNGGGDRDRSHWRREQVNLFIRQLYDRIKATRQSVKVGVSPFGIWRPGVPTGIVAYLDAFDDIYADSRTWLREGWVDYLAPQLYWKISGPQDFVSLFEWWQGQNVTRRGAHLWPGISTARIGRSGVGEGDGRDANEIDRQIDITRGTPERPVAPAAGHIHWSISALKKNTGGIADHLREKTNRTKALVPASPWLAEWQTPGIAATTSRSTPLPRAEIVVRPDKNTIGVSWDLAVPPPNLRWWCVQVRSGAIWRVVRILSADARETSVPVSIDGAKVDTIALRAVDKIGRSGPVSVAVPAGR
jgi:uncharacterized lipoprotein YddW (UPF0748 family)